MCFMLYFIVSQVKSPPPSLKLTIELIRLSTAWEYEYLSGVGPTLGPLTPGKFH